MSLYNPVPRSLVQLEDVVSVGILWRLLVEPGLERGRWAFSIPEQQIFLSRSNRMCVSLCVCCEAYTYMISILTGPLSFFWQMPEWHIQFNGEKIMQGGGPREQNEVKFCLCLRHPKIC